MNWPTFLRDTAGELGINPPEPISEYEKVFQHNILALWKMRRRLREGREQIRISHRERILSGRVKKTQGARLIGEGICSYSIFSMFYAAFN